MKMIKALNEGPEELQQFCVVLSALLVMLCSSFLCVQLCRGLCAERRQHAVSLHARLLRTRLRKVSGPVLQMPGWTFMLTTQHMFRGPTHLSERQPITKRGGLKGADLKQVV